MIDQADDPAPAAEAKGHVVDIEALPSLWPTTAHEAAFWEALGRTVATFGFLEEILGKAIFAFTATKVYEDERLLVEAYDQWAPTLERALSNPLGALIGTYEKCVLANGKTDPTWFAKLIEDLREAAALRNALCHGSWKLPDDQGRALPFYVTRKQEQFETAMNIDALLQTQRAVAEMAGAVMNTVTALGWQFPGSGGPGISIGPAKT
jgi:uncharacterized protein YutE (UPF0331/DUF86 family)